MSAVKLTQSLRNGHISSRELCEHYLSRIVTHNPALNAVVTLDSERARAEADAADAALSRGEALGPLHGLPMTVKDHYATSGMRTTGGNRATRRFVPDYDAVPVARLRAVGAVIMGKTNMPRMGADVQTYNSSFGTTTTPGTSSGLLEDHLAARPLPWQPASLGSRSGRTLPGRSGSPPTTAACTATSRPLVLCRILLGPSPPGYRADHDMATPAPIARSADDLELALDVLAGPDKARSVAWRLELPAAQRSSLVDYRVGAWLDDPDCPTHPRCWRPSKPQLMPCAEPVSQLMKRSTRFQPEGLLPQLPEAAVRAICHGLPFAGLWPTKVPWFFTPPVPGDNQVSRVLRYEGASHRDWILAHETRQEYQQAWAAFFEATTSCCVRPVRWRPSPTTTTSAEPSSFGTCGEVVAGDRMRTK